MSTRINSLVWGLVLICGASLTAQTGVRLVPPPRPGVTFAESWRPPNTKSDTRVIGTVIDIRQVPVAYAKVQLRNLVTGKVAMETLANGNGEYEFLIDDPGTYVVEMTMIDGYVLALSNAGSLARYETLQHRRAAARALGRRVAKHDHAAERRELSRHELADHHDGDDLDARRRPEHRTP